VSKHVQIGEGNIRPLGQDNLGRRGNQSVVYDFGERGLLAPVTPGSTMKSQSPSVGVSHAHLFMAISVPEGAGRCELSIPRMCISYPRTLWPGTNNVCMHRVAGVDQMPLTDNEPHLKHHRKVSCLNDGQADTTSVVGDTHE